MRHDGGVRRLPEPTGLAQLVPLGGRRHQAAVVGPEDLLQPQQHEQLGLGVSEPRVWVAYAGSVARPAASASRATHRVRRSVASTAGACSGEALLLWTERPVKPRVSCLMAPRRLG